MIPKTFFMIFELSTNNLISLVWTLFLITIHSNSYLCLPQVIWFHPLSYRDTSQSFSYWVNNKWWDCWLQI